MSARVLAGAPVARDILGGLSGRVGSLRSNGINPRLVFVMTGDAAEGIMYARRLARIAEPIGVEVVRHGLPDEVTLAELDRDVAMLNGDTRVDGIIVQMPLPPPLSYGDLATIIDPRKDVDGITVENAGRLYLGLPGPVASTGVAMVEILDHAEIDPRGMHAVVIGRSQVVGHPVAELLLRRNATVTITHRQTRNLAALSRVADLLMVGAGAPGTVTANMIRPGVVIVDAGINVTERGVVGDVEFDACLPVASAITQVPGGVGPVTSAVLLRNLVESAERRGA